MKLQEFIDEYVMTDPEWRDAYDESDATREAARAIARARMAAGLSQAELAERSGTAQAVISRIERGVVSPSLETFGKIARGLGMRPVVALEAAKAVRAAKRRRKPTNARRKGA
jgi:transcriptional regulator with XRE-family HTH domain